MEKATKRHFLSARCYFSNLTGQVSNIMGRLLAEENEILKDCNVLSILTAPKVPQNIPLLYFLVSAYDSKNDSFLIGSRKLSFTPNDIAIITGLPNNGEKLNMKLRPYGIRTRTSLRKEIAEMNNGSSQICLKSVILHVICNFFFPSSLEPIPEQFEALSEFDAFRKINWAQAIHSYLMSSVKTVRGKIVSPPTNYIYTRPQESLGYLYGCTHVLIIWYLEHTTSNHASFPDERPRLLRWSEKCTFTLKNLWTDMPQMDVRVEMEDVTPSEKNLYCVVDLKRKRPKKTLKEDVSPLPLTIRRLESAEEAEEPSSPIKDGQLPPDFEKMITTLGKRLFARLRKMNKKIDSLSTRVDELIKCQKERQSPSRQSHSPSMHCTATGLEIGVVDIKDSPYKGAKSTAKDNCIEPYNEDYPGRMLLPEEKRDFIHARMSSIPSKNHIAFTGWNIIAFRDSMEELLSTGYIGDCHVDAYAKILEIRREKDVHTSRPFLYISPNLWLHNQDQNATIKYTDVKKFVSHITKTSIELSQILLMPVCRAAHWFLLVGLASKKKWLIHDPLPNPKRKEVARESIKILQKATQGRTNINFNDWGLVLAKNVPRQATTYDCGVYVIKYMEHIVRPGVVDWQECKDWAQKMALFRAEIAYDILKIFVLDDEI